MQDQRVPDGARGTVGSRRTVDDEDPVAGLGDVPGEFGLAEVLRDEGLDVLARERGWAGEREGPRGERRDGGGVLRLRDPGR
ncbi:hypothetical protein AXK61_11915 [Tsukamurella pseudospumae]|uniref:Uncharacterized protein n=1 Tax=Tsukamurella pseudospumae TaxID=239498 RepID=A0A137YTI3_9ACTN|nr:hypothetical protein AXK61_11915 [Tsukamurella pseudospumae]